MVTSVVFLERTMPCSVQPLGLFGGDVATVVVVAPATVVVVVPAKVVVVVFVVVVDVVVVVPPPPPPFGAIVMERVRVAGWPLPSVAVTLNPKVLLTVGVPLMS